MKALPAVEKEVKKVRLSELFQPGKDTLFLYNFMYPESVDSMTPCPSCTSIIDAVDGAARHVTQRINLAVRRESSDRDFSPPRPQSAVAGATLSCSRQRATLFNLPTTARRRRLTVNNSRWLTFSCAAGRRSGISGAASCCSRVRDFLARTCATWTSPPCGRCGASSTPLPKRRGATWGPELQVLSERRSAQEKFRPDVDLG